MRHAEHRQHLDGSRHDRTWILLLKTSVTAAGQWLASMVATKVRPSLAALSVWSCFLGTPRAGHSLRQPVSAD